MSRSIAVASARNHRVHSSAARGTDLGNSLDASIFVEWLPLAGGHFFLHPALFIISTDILREPDYPAYAFIVAQIAYFVNGFPEKAIAGGRRLGKKSRLFLLSLSSSVQWFSRKGSGFLQFRDVWWI